MSILCQRCAHVLDLGAKFCSDCGAHVGSTISAQMRAQDRPTNPQFADRAVAQMRSEAERVKYQARTPGQLARETEGYHARLARNPPIPRDDRDQEELSEAVRAFRKASEQMRALNPGGPHLGKGRAIGRIKKKETVDE